MKPPTNHAEPFDLEVILRSMTWQDSGRRTLGDREFTIRSAEPSEQFWQSHRKAKEALKLAGLHVTKESGSWRVEHLIESNAQPASQSTTTAETVEVAVTSTPEVTTLPTAEATQETTPESAKESAKESAPEATPKAATEATKEAAYLHCDDDFGRLAPRKIKIVNIVVSELFSATHDDIHEPALVESIKTNGILNPIAVTAGPPHYLLSGRDRLEIFVNLGYDVIDSYVLNVRKDQIAEYILEFDVRREIGNIEKTRRFGGYLAVEQIRAQKRKKAGTKLMGNSPKGSARDIAGDRTGMDGKTLEDALRLLREIDRRLGDPALAPSAKAVRAVFDKSIHGAFEKAYKAGWDIPWWRPKRSKQKAVVESSSSAGDGVAASSGGSGHHDEPEQKDKTGDPEFLTPKRIAATAQTLWSDSIDRAQVTNFTRSIAGNLERVTRLYPESKGSELLQKASRLVAAIEAQHPVELPSKVATAPHESPGSDAPSGGVLLDPIVETPAA